MHFAFHYIQHRIFISTNILAKMGKDEPVSMDSLAKICIALGCTLDDIVEISADPAAGGKANGKE